MIKQVEPANTAAVIEEGCFVSGALAKVLRVSRYLGTASLRFAKKKDGSRITLCPGLSLFSSLIVTITGFWNMATNFSDKLYSIQDKDSEWSTVQHAMRFAESFVICFMTMWMVYNAPAHMKHMVRCLNQVHKIQLELKINYWPKQQKKHVVLVMLWLTLGVIVSSCDYYAVSIFKNDSPLWIKIGEFLYYLHYVVIQTRQVQFVLIVVHVNSNFRTINDFLRSYLKETDKKPSALSDSFHTLCCAYGATCCVVRTVNRAQGTMLMLMIAFIFQHLMTTLYFFVTNVVYSDSTSDEDFYVFYGVVLLIWTILHLFHLLLVIEPCHLTHLEMETTRDLVSHLMRCTDSGNDSLAAELELFYKTITVNKINYQPLSVITMCRGLVIEILGSVTTYLVILIKIK